MKLRKKKAVWKVNETGARARMCSSGLVLSGRESGASLVGSEEALEKMAQASQRSGARQWCRILAKGRYMNARGRF